MRPEAHSLFIVLLLPSAWAGELLPADRAAAQHALAALVGIARSRNFELTASGCGSDACTSVVTRTAVFTQRYARLTPSVATISEVHCRGKKEEWSCIPELQRGLFEVGGKRETPVLGSIEPRSAFEVASFIRSDCYSKALYEKYVTSVPAWAAGELPILRIERSSLSQIAVTLGDSSMGLRIAIRPLPAESQCPFELISAKTYVS